jgi:RNA polymerase sigma-70 factor (ECF subfamily)
MALHPPDANEVLAARAGNSAALNSLTVRSLPHVLQWCTRLGGPRVDPEDAAHDVMIVMLGRLHTLTDPDMFGSWLFGITRRVLAGHRRRRWFESWIPGMHASVDSDSDPLRSAEGSDLSRRVQSALEDLSAEHREILVLTDIEERPEREVAELLKLPIGTVRSRVHRARTAFLKVAEKHHLPTIVFETGRSHGAREGSA